MTPLSIRPFQLACLICRQGASEPDEIQQRVAGLAEAIRQSPDQPLQLRCNVGEIFAYQAPGPAEDTPEGADFNRKRDFDFLQWLDLAPGSILPARVLLKRLLLRVPTVEGICGSKTPTSPAWRGCAKAFSGDYERGHEIGLTGLIPPRPEPEKIEAKQQFVAALASATVIDMRPHLLLCAMCQYGGGLRPPFPEDNLPEFVQRALEPDCRLQVRLVPGAPEDMCGPCPHRNAEGCCVIGRTSTGGLYNEVKDVNVLQALGLTYGAVLGAREIYRLIFERIPTVDGICALTKIPVADYSIWRDGCHSMQLPGPYERARAELWAAFECAGQP